MNSKDTIVNQALSSRVMRNFFVHSGHIPLALLILEALLATPGYFMRFDPYLLLGAGVFQALAIERMASLAKKQIFWGNLIGPMVYSVSEALIEGPDFFMQWHHQAYWIFSLGFGVLQTLEAQRGRLYSMFVLIENVLRSSIPLAIYFLFEARSSSLILSFSDFFEDQAHSFLTIILLLLGVLLGFADINLRRSSAKVNELTARLRQYSEWSLGRGILEQAITNENALSLKRVERAVLFLDIRGFTAWSEQQTPETVVGVLDAFYQAAESALSATLPIKLKYTADEVMAVFSDAAQAVTAGACMLDAVQPMLIRHRLSAGAGVHFGQVVEGVMGAKDSKAYDFIGDTVNTAQRLCDAAESGELLVSMFASAAANLPPGAMREVHAKGKREPIQASNQNS
jgi:adenylate cyclase